MPPKKVVASKSDAAPPTPTSDEDALLARMLQVSTLTLNTLIASSEANVPLRLSLGTVALESSEYGCVLHIGDPGAHAPETDDFAHMAGLLFGGTLFQKRSNKG